MDSHLAAIGKLTDDIVLQTQSLLEDSRDFSTSTLPQSTGEKSKRGDIGGIWRIGIGIDIRPFVLISLSVIKELTVRQSGTIWTLVMYIEPVRCENNNRLN